MNALANDKVADLLNERFVSTYQKVGTFRIVNGQKQGGNVASYFCRPDGTVLHGIAGQVKAEAFIAEARWAVDLHKAALNDATNLTSGNCDASKYRALVRQAHSDRYNMETNPGAAEQTLERMRRRSGSRGYGNQDTQIAHLPAGLPEGVSNRAKVHWLLFTRTLPLGSLPALGDVSRIVWEDILGESFSTLPVLRK